MSTSDVYVLTATAKQLKELLAAKNLPTYGSKANMRERLLDPSAKRKRVPKPKDARIAKRVATLHTSTRPCDSTEEVMRIGGCPRSMSVGQCTRRITLSPLSELSFDLWEHVLEFLSPLDMNLGFFQTCQALYALKKRVRRIVLKGRPRIPPTVVHLLAGFASLTTVDLSYTSFTSQGILAIADALQTGTLVALTDLNLFRNRICGLDLMGEGTYTDIGIKALAEALKISSTLKSLNVGYNFLREGAALSIVRAAKQQDTMEVLGLAWCDIGLPGAAALADYISLSSALKKLVLAGNWIRDGGASAFGQGLKDNKMLEELDLCTCGIGPAGGQGLAEGLFSSALTNLNLCRNRIGPTGAAALAEALKVNSALKNLDVGWNELNEEAALSIVRAARQQDKVEVLGLADCGIGPAGAAELADYISFSSALTNLNLGSNRIGPTGAAALAEALKVNSALTSLDLCANNIGPTGAAAIAKALQVSSAELKSPSASP